MRSPLKTRLLAWMIVGFYYVYSKLWRVVEVAKPDLSATHGRCLYAHWHGDELALIGPFAFRQLAVMVSRSRDGELLQIVLQRLGYQVVRGSSSRGGAGGLKGLIDATTDRRLSASLAVDGPRGPIYQVKPGIIMLAQQSGLPIVPGAVAASRRYTFEKAWNRCFLPLPLSRCVIVYGDPVVVPAAATAEEREQIRCDLEETLTKLKGDAEGYFQKAQPYAQCGSLQRGV